MAIIGIDFGDKNSCISQMKKTTNEIVINSQSNRCTPSVISFKGKYTVGESVGNLIISNSDKTYYNFKRILNLFECSTNNLFLKNYEKRDNTLYFKISEKESISIEQILAFYFKHLISNIGSNISKSEIVIAIPYFYTEKQRNVILNACKIIDVDVKCLISDYIAVAIDYSIFEFAKNGYKEEEIINILDIGAESLCFSNIKFLEKDLKVIYVNHINNFGGNYIDELLVKYFSNKINKDYNLDVLNNSKLYEKLYQVCEKLKKDITLGNQASIFIENFYQDIDIKYSVNRTEYLEITKNLDKQLLDFLNKYCQGSQKFKTLIVGSGNRIYNFKKIIDDFFKDNISKQANMEESVARGCGYLSGMLSNNSVIKSINIYDMLTEPIEIIVQNSKINKVLFEKTFYFPQKKQMVIKSVSMKLLFMI